MSTDDRWLAGGGGGVGGAVRVGGFDLKSLGMKECRPPPLCECNDKHCIPLLTVSASALVCSVIGKHASSSSVNAAVGRCSSVGDFTPKMLASKEGRSPPLCANGA